jgi:uncharacterized protein involved in exopolysaccharide biosynthesis
MIEPAHAPFSVGPPSEPEPTLSLFQIANLLMRSRYLLLILPLLGAITGAAYSLAQPREYKATASFVPNGADASGSQLSSLAAQFGFSVSSGQPGQSPQFYGDLLVTRDILRDAVLTRYPLRASRPANLIHAYGLDEPGKVSNAPGHSPLDEAITTLRAAVNTDVGLETGVVRVSVLSPEPKLSEAILDRLLRLTQEFDLTKRRTQASARRQFAEARLRDARTDLRHAEAALEEFVNHNRLFQNSPLQELDHARLSQELALRQQLYTALLQTYEQARIDEVRNTPVITVLETPDGTATAQSRGTVRRILVCAVLAGLLGLFIALLRETVRSARSSRDAEFAEFLSLRETFVRDVRRLVPFGRAPVARRDAKG